MDFQIVVTLLNLCDLNVCDITGEDTGFRKGGGGGVRVTVKY